MNITDRKAARRTAAYRMYRNLKQAQWGARPFNGGHVARLRRIEREYRQSAFGRALLRGLGHAAALKAVTK